MSDCKYSLYRTPSWSVFIMYKSCFIQKVHWVSCRVFLKIQMPFYRLFYFFVAFYRSPVVISIIAFNRGHVILYPISFKSFSQCWVRWHKFTFQSICKWKQVLICFKLEAKYWCTSPSISVSFGRTGRDVCFLSRHLNKFCNKTFS